MKWCSVVAVLPVLLAGNSAFAQVEVPDFRLRADFRTPNDGGWGANESVGHAEVRVQSRFLQVYYGGVSRNDEYKFKVQIDFRDISGFAEQFDSSVYNSDFDVYINNGFVGRVLMGTEAAGLAELVYDSRHPSFPELPLPEAFPDVVSEFDLVSVYFAFGEVPAVGDPAVLGVPLFEAELVEEFARGDANQDGKVDEDDYEILASNYDPFYRLGEHVGPMLGDFTGDNLADLGDYELLVANWTDSHDVPPEPQAVIGLCDADLVPDGVLDVFDVFAYLDAFVSMDPSADITGDGVFDVFDVFGYLSQLNAGCP